MNIVQNILGGGQQRQDDQGFVDQYQQGHPWEGYADQEVMQRYGQVASYLSRAQYQQAAQESFVRLTPPQRLQFGQHLQQQGYAAPFPDANRDGVDDRYQDPNDPAQTMGRMQQQNPDMRHQLFGHGGALGNPLAKAAVAGIATLAAKQFLGQ